MDNYQSATLNKKTFSQVGATHAMHQIEVFIKTCRSPTGTVFNKIPNSAKTIILLITSIHTKVLINAN
ncbi:hypothetical protein SPBRAN_59 [uncultured Candidatus Thioglobus sp.]|nr:hypothetical protein SPBRAN_59 [uncultured Candidatus Thioglobus sp.]